MLNPETAKNLDIPRLTVIATDYFDLFMKQNNLYEIAYSDKRDELIAHAFQKAELPVQLVGDIRALLMSIRTPLAVRSSSMLEDKMFEPFASVYETKMIPNNLPDIDARFRKLVEAIKFIYASTFFKGAKNYMKVTHNHTRDEKMAVIIQEVVGTRYDQRFYPNISGVARSYNYYPTGHAVAEDGIVDLALGLGKSIVDDGKAWTFSPAYPRSDPPYNSIGDLLNTSQNSFWAVNMGPPPAYDPINEAEYLVKCDLKDSEYDNSLNFLVSTYSPENDRLSVGIYGKGPKLVNFSPILKTSQLPLSDLLGEILKTFRDSYGTDIEIEFAMVLDRKNCTPARLGFLQIRPMVVSRGNVEIDQSELTSENVVLASETVLGNGILNDIRNIVYIKPESFTSKNTMTVAGELAQLNRNLVESKKPYLLIGFGRWGTSDPLAGIPVKFDQIAGAKVIVESTLPEMNFPLSQGSHFFHNVTSFKILYLSMLHQGKFKIDWNWLNKQVSIDETEYIRHVEVSKPLLIKVDSKNSVGVITHE